MESGSDARADRRRMDAANFGTIPQVVKTIGAMQMQLVAHVRELHRAAGTADADGYRRQSLRRERGGVGAQWLGPVASRGCTRAWGWIGPSATGTDYIGQYSPAVARMYESLETCPDDLLLFMHHVPYTYVLHSGKTVIQSIYDSHYEGAEAVEAMCRLEIAEGPGGRAALSRKCWRSWSIRPDRPWCGAMR